MFQRLNLITVMLCYALVVLGAFVRLSDAGLGCPDWPGCYGQLAVPDAAHELAHAQAAFPQRPVVAHKAWKEMIHRYLAGVVGLLIAALAVLAWRARLPERGLAAAVVGVVIAQIVFGALTVTMRVNPLIVTTHLLLGLTTLSLLWWMWLGGRPHAAAARPPGLRLVAGIALGLLIVQIFLGGWTSTNYAALACPDFPACLGSLAPQTSLARAFTLWHGGGRDYEFGILDTAARASIHLVHRYGALVVALSLVSLSGYLLAQAGSPRWRQLGVTLLAALSLQVAIGIGLVKLQLPLWLADAHNAGAALLLLAVLAVNFFAREAPPGRNPGKIRA